MISTSTMLTCGFGAHQRRELIDSQWLAERPPQICPRTPPFRVTKEREKKRKREFNINSFLYRVNVRRIERRDSTKACTQVLSISVQHSATDYSIGRYSMYIDICICIYRVIQHTTRGMYIYICIYTYVTRGRSTFYWRKD